MTVVQWAKTMLLLVIVSPGWGSELKAIIDWARRVELSIPVSGVVLEVRGQPGSRVSKGELLYRLDPRRFTMAVHAAQARVDQARPVREEAQQEMTRAEDLYERTVLSEHELQVAKIELAEAVSKLRIAQAALEEAQLDLEYSEVHAPFEGIVLERRINPGETVASGLQAVPLMVLAETGAYVARMSVTKQQLTALHNESHLKVRLGDLVFKARPYRHWPEPFERTESDPLYQVDIVFHTKEPDLLYPGQKAAVDVP